MMGVAQRKWQYQQPLLVLSQYLLIFTLCCLSECRRIIECPQWTVWLNSDTPSGSGDFETPSRVRYYGDFTEICVNPTAIEGRVVKTAVLAEETGQHFDYFNEKRGLICINRKQRNNRGRCLDYEVRYCCPKVVVPDCPYDSWTRWYSDNFNGHYGDWETLRELQAYYPGEICSHPTAIHAQTTYGLPLEWTADKMTIYDSHVGLICSHAKQKSVLCEDYQVRFCCPHNQMTECSGRWSNFYNTDHPYQGDGDWETVAQILAIYSETMCPNPIGIDVRAPDGQPAWTTGQTFHYHEATTGFLCLNVEQKEGTKCQDYSVRFCCPQKCTSKPKKEEKKENEDFIDHVNDHLIEPTMKVKEEYYDELIDLYDMY